ncbi:methyltransferase domain-containing protein [Actinomadura sp. WMMA1423]|uniref:methyltransferase domain-containing protein n=1 Tax=Actinomadura sp. WMMA1423 TaxID=2591108 RepID=UPI001F0CDE85|nr:methyltransferase domain-containing protein [Actinomadura sp. WMMA1423]
MPTPIDELVALLDAHDVKPDATRLRARTYELLAITPDAVMADVGCGTGRAVAEMAALGAHAIGVDLNERMLATAHDRFAEGDFRLGDAAALPFRDGELRGYRADKVLHALPEPERAVAEAWRVLAPGGRAVLCGQDWDTFVVDSAHPELTRAIVHARADRVATPRAARRYRNLLLGAGFRDAAVEVHTTVLTGADALPVLAKLVEACRAGGDVTDAEAGAWLADQRERAADDRAFLAFPIFIASATRPPSP